HDESQAVVRRARDEADRDEQPARMLAPQVLWQLHLDLNPIATDLPALGDLRCARAVSKYRSCPQLRLAGIRLAVSRIDENLRFRRGHSIPWGDESQDSESERQAR